MLPDRAVEGGNGAFRNRLADVAQRQKIAGEILENACRNERPDFSYAVVTDHEKDPLDQRQKYFRHQLAEKPTADYGGGDRNPPRRDVGGRRLNGFSRHERGRRALHHALSRPTEDSRIINR